MRASVTLFLDEISGILLGSSDIIASYEQSAIEFSDQLIAWISEAEHCLRKFNYTQVSSISGIKAQILAAKNGILDSDIVQLPSHSTSKRKQSSAIKAILFNRAQNILNELHANATAKKEEALKYLRQIIQFSDQQNILQTFNWSNRSQALVSLFTMMQNNPNTAMAARHVLSQVNFADALRLSDEILSEWGILNNYN